MNRVVGDYLRSDGRLAAFFNNTQQITREKLAPILRDLGVGKNNRNIWDPKNKKYPNRSEAFKWLKNLVNDASSIEDAYRNALKVRSAFARGGFS
jgi:hypothetical protein